MDALPGATAIGATVIATGLLRKETTSNLLLIQPGVLGELISTGGFTIALATVMYAVIVMSTAKTRQLTFACSCASERRFLTDCYRRYKS